MTIPVSHAVLRVGPASGPGKRVAGTRLVLQAHSPGERPREKALPAVVVLGRSNVGKSSLLNAILKTKVARVSATPGRTQALFWYRVGETFDVVDCPGYGYAKTAKEKRRGFEILIEEFLTGEPGPAGALLLVDGRLTPQESDRSMALFLAETGIRTVVAATKWDAVKPSERVRRLRELAAEYQDSIRPLLPVSAETGENLSELVRLVQTLTQPSGGAGPRAANTSS